MLFAKLPQTTISPFFGTLLLYANTACTSINSGVRLDGLGVVAEISRCYPRLMSTGSGILVPSFLEMIIKAADRKSRDVLLESFYSFFSIINQSKKQSSSISNRYILLNETQDIPRISMFGNAKDDGVNGFDSLKSNATSTYSFIPNNSGASGMTDTPYAKAATDPKYSAHYERLVPVLINFWIESSELVFNASNQLTATSHFKTCHLVVKILGCIVNQSPVAMMKEWIKNVTKHITAYFPFGQNDSISCRDPSVVAELDNMNIDFGLIMMKFAESEKILQNHEQAERIMQQIKKFLTDTFQPGTKISNLPSALSLFDICLNFSESYAHRSSLFGVLNDYQKSSPSLAMRYKIFTLMANCNLHSNNDHKDYQEWILSLPKLIWQLKSSNLDFTSSILLFLAVQLKTHRVSGTTVSRLQSSLIPLFSCSVSTKTQPESKTVFGPFLKYPESVQKLSIDLLFYLSTWDEGLSNALNTVFQNPDLFESKILDYFKGLLHVRKQTV